MIATKNKQALFSGLYVNTIPLLTSTSLPGSNLSTVTSILSSPENFYEVAKHHYCLTDCPTHTELLCLKKIISPVEKFSLYSRESTEMLPTKKHSNEDLL